MKTDLPVKKERATPNLIGVIGIYLFFAAVFARTLLSTEEADHTTIYLVFNSLFILLFSLVLWRPSLPEPVKHLIVIILCAVIILNQAIEPEEDSTNALFVIAGYLVGFVFRGRTRLAWTLLLIALCGITQMINLGALEGLSKSLLNIAGIIIFSSYFATNQEIDQARTCSQTMLVELEESHQKLQTYASQVEELSSMQERIRLARELHDSVSQTMFSIILNTRSAQLLLARDPSRLKTQLDLLQNLSQNALLEMRGLIAELRPKKE